MIDTLRLNISILLSKLAWVILDFADVVDPYELGGLE